MNLTKHLTARRLWRRVVTFALAYLLMLMGLSSLRLDNSTARAAVQQQQTTKHAATSKGKGAQTSAPQAVQPISKPAKGAQALVVGPDSGRVVPESTSCPNKTPISAGQTVNGTLSNGDCALQLIDDQHNGQVVSDGSVYDEYTFTATAGQQVSVSMSSTDIDTYLFLLKPSETIPHIDPSRTFQNDDDCSNPNENLCPTTSNSRIPRTKDGDFITLPESGTYSILANVFIDANNPRPFGNYMLTLTFGNVCAATPIANGQTVTGSLTTGDCTLQDGSFYDSYTFTANAGQQVAITMTANSSFNAYLILYEPLPAPDGSTDIAEDGPTTTPLPPAPTNARIPNGSGFVVLPETGTYTIFANAAAPGQTGNYTLSLSVSNSNCPTTPIAAGQSINGSLVGTDCRLPLDGSFLDAYTFNGTQGQQIAVTMTSTALNAYLILLSPTGVDLAEDNDSGGGTNARLPDATGFFTLPTTGTYTIYANSFVAGTIGNYTIALASSVSCTYAFAQPSASAPAAGGSFSVGVTTQSGCPLTASQVTSNQSWLTIGNVTVDAAGAGTINYTVAANSTTSTRTGTLTLAGQTFTVTQAAQAAACTYAIFPVLQPFNSGGSAGGRMTVVTNGGACSWTAAADMPWITITNGASGTGTGRVRYTVAANADATTRVGHITITGGATTLTHTVTETAANTTPSVSFSAATYTVNENNVDLVNGTNSARITVNRTGDTAGAVTVEYSTVDDPAAVPCDPNATSNGQPFPHGTAYARCDYASTIDTLTFAPGESTKSFTIPLINDVHVEGNETFQIKLANPQGATLGAQNTATVTIVDDDTAQPTTNPINQTPFFVRMQYLDFLAREPDPSGFSAWTNLLNNCSDVNNNPNCDRLIVSQSFFTSPEFQLKGTFVFLFNKVAFGAPNTPNFVPQYVDFVADLRRVTGTTSEEVFAKRLDYTEDFVTRPAFISRYGGLSNADYVDALLANVGAHLTTADPVSGVTRNSLVNDLNTGAKTRADVLRAIVESQEVNQIQANFAFVAVQYYGYLRRTPEPTGYNAWLAYLNAHPTDLRTMVNGFMNSAEYKLRFGPNV